MPNPAMASAAVAAIGATGLLTMNVAEAKQKTHNAEKDLLPSAKQQQGDGFSPQLAV